MPFFPLGLVTGGPYQPLSGELTALADLGSPGYIRKVSPNAYALDTVIPTSRGGVGQDTAVYALGDSLTARNLYEPPLDALLGDGWYVANRGVGANQTSQMLARLQDQIIDVGDAKYCIVFGGINDIAQLQTAASIKANLQAIYSALNAAGIIVIAVKMTPWRGYASWFSGGQAILEDVNLWISSTATDVDYIVDGYTVIGDPSDPEYILPAYDSGDGLHFNQAGGDALAAAIFAAATWTERTTIGSVSTTGPDVVLNQNLTEDSAVSFQNITSTGFLRATPSLSYPSTGIGMEFVYDSVNDEARFAAYDRDNSLWKPLLINASVIGLLAQVGNITLQAPFWVNPAWTAGILASNGAGTIGPTLNPEAETLELSPGSDSSVDLLALTLNNGGENGSLIVFNNAFGPLAQIAGTKEGGGALADDGLITFSLATNSVLGLQFSITRSGILSAAPSGGSAHPWKLGNYTAGIAVQAGKVRVEINGVAYDLLTA